MIQSCIFVIVYTLCQFVWDKDDIPYVYVLADEMNLNHAEWKQRLVSTDDSVVFKN